jgi:hypothetical protein
MARLTVILEAANLRPSSASLGNRAPAINLPEAISRWRAA